MNLKSLEDKKLAIETAFDSLTAQKKEYTDKVGELDTELIKLQGEYRLLEELIVDFKKEKKDAK